MSKYNRYATYAERLQSFEGWPRRYVEQTPESLAGAGFFYTGSADRVTCFSCHQTLRNWNPGQDPVAQHKLASPDCSFLKSITAGQKEEEDTPKAPVSAAAAAAAPTALCPQDMLALGDTEYPLAKVKSLLSGRQEGDYCFDTNVLVGYVLQTPPAVSIAGFDKMKIETNSALAASVASTTVTATTTTTKTKDLKPTKDKSPDNIKNAKQVNGEAAKEEINASTIKEEFRNRESPETKESIAKNDLISRVKEENKMLKQQRLCKICYKNEARILVLPCSHIVYCSDCVDKEIRCVKCKKLIRGTVKVFLS